MQAMKRVPCWLASRTDVLPNFVPFALGSFDTGLTALADQFPLKLGDAAHDREHETAHLIRGVAPRIIKGNEATAAFLESWMMFSRSRAERATRSSFVTTTVKSQLPKIHPATNFSFGGEGR